MSVRTHTLTVSALAVCLLVTSMLSEPIRGQAAAPRGRVTIRTSAADRRAWSARVDSLLRSGELRVRRQMPDTLLAGRTHERADQYHRGVRVFGGDVARQVRNGVTESVFGTMYEGIDIETAPDTDAEGARAVLAARLGVDMDPSIEPELVVLPQEDGSYALAWRMRVAMRRGARQYFLDAHSGETILDYNDRKTQSAVGRALGVLGDTKKISVRSATGQFLTSDELRPPTIETYDLRGDPVRADNFLLRRLTLGTSDLGSDPDNDWTDTALGDAHIYAGYTYDYFFKRFGRKGLNDADINIQAIVHPVRRADFFTYIEDYEDYFVNAFYDGSGIVVFGEGLPGNVTLGGQNWDYLAGAIDIVAHELAHGVTEYTSNLIYRNESGALNEAFSDVMGTGVEFFFQPAGSGALKADYEMGEDAVRPGGIRNMANPGVFGDPDHYSKRYTGPADNGGVHLNATIATHAFYLAIEGGTNRTSGLAVQGVGSANREQIEKTFYRAFTQLLPADATFSTARAATIQAAQDLYGGSSAAVRAVTQAWTAVGVN
jgi:bacillolysin